MSPFSTTVFWEYIVVHVGIRLYFRLHWIEMEVLLFFNLLQRWLMAFGSYRCFFFKNSLTCSAWVTVSFSNFDLLEPKRMSHIRLHHLQLQWVTPRLFKTCFLQEISVVLTTTLHKFNISKIKSVMCTRVFQTSWSCIIIAPPYLNYSDHTGDNNSVLESGISIKWDK